MTNDELKPCPFCGGSAAHDRWDEGRDYYGCRSCDFWVNGIGLWNRRAKDSVADIDAAITGDKP